MRPKVIHYGKWNSDVSWANIWHKDAGLKFQIYRMKEGENILVLATAYYEAPIHREIRMSVESQEPSWTFRGCGCVTLGTIRFYSDNSEHHVADFRPSDPNEADRLLTEAIECLATLGITVEKA